LSTKPNENPELDRARADALYWATVPKEERAKHAAAHLNAEQPCPFSLFRSIMNMRATAAKVKFKRPKDKDADDFDLLLHFSDDRQFNPKLDRILAEDQVCAFGKTFTDNLLAGTMAVSGKRAEKVLETVKDIGRPQSGLFGALGSLFENKDNIQTREVEAVE